MITSKCGHTKFIQKAHCIWVGWARPRAFPCCFSSLETHVIWNSNFLMAANVKTALPRLLSGQLKRNQLYHRSMEGVYLHVMVFIIYTMIFVCMCLYIHTHSHTYTHTWGHMNIKTHEHKQFAGVLSTVIDVSIFLCEYPYACIYIEKGHILHSWSTLIEHKPT